MDALDGALERLFQTHGYTTTRAAALEGRSGAVYGAPVLAETPTRVLLVERSGPETSVRRDDVQELRRVVEDTGAHMGILVALGPVEDQAVDAGRGRVCVWDRIATARFLGEADLHRVAGVPLGGLPLRTGGPVADSPETRLPGSLADMLPSAFQGDGAEDEEMPVFGEEGGHATEAPLDDATGPTSPFDLDAFESLATGDPAPAPPDAADAAGPAGPTPPAGPAEPPEEAFGLPFAMDLQTDAGQPGTRTASAGSDLTPSAPFPSPDPPATTIEALAPRIDPQQAARSVEGRLFAVDKAELVLQPVHLFDYECDLLVEGSLKYDTVRGRLEVHGTSKAVRDVDPLHLDPAKVRPLPAGPDGPAEERTLRVRPDRAERHVREHLLETHTREVDIETGDPDDDYSVTERKKVAPRPDQIRIEPLGVVLRPQWRLRGPNGAMLVDALDGRVLEESLKSPDPDIIMMD